LPVDTVLNNKPPVIKKENDCITTQQLLLHLTQDSITEKWPTRNRQVRSDALLPHYRIIAYYGNFSSKKMGILGALPPDSMLQGLLTEVKKWSAADTLIPPLPALHLVSVIAQLDPGKDGKYRSRISYAQIDKALLLARKIHGIVILDLQLGWSSVSAELPYLIHYLKLPDVHLAIDPEFSMYDTLIPGSAIGKISAVDINHAIRYLSVLVQKYHVPPKLLILHSFRERMIANYKSIKLTPEVQVVMNMDAWGTSDAKIKTYNMIQSKCAVDFTGFKLFYKHDVRASYGKSIMQPLEILKLYPSPIYIQYQ